MDGAAGTGDEEAAVDDADGTDPAGFFITASFFAAGSVLISCAEDSITAGSSLIPTFESARAGFFLAVFEVTAPPRSLIADSRAFLRSPLHIHLDSTSPRWAA